MSADTPGVADEWVVRFGDIGVSRNFLSTPSGISALKGTTFSIVDRTVAAQRIPTWAVIAAIVGFFVIFVLSLLFLLVKETAPAGTVEVTAANPETGVRHTTSLAITSSGDIADAYARVNAAQQLAASAAPVV